MLNSNDLGPESLPQYPVPTCCRPELVINCLIPVTGDFDGSGMVTSSDIIRTVGYIFKGGAPPHPCAALADVNCSGTVTARDVIELVSYIFKGGPPPCDVCSLIPDVWTCP